MTHLRAAVGLLSILAACAVPETRPPAPVADAAGGGLTVSGLLSRTGPLSQQELESLGAEDVKWTFRDQEHVYGGIPLHKLLAHLGFTAGEGGPTMPPRERRPGWRKVVVASAADGSSRCSPLPS